MTSREPWDDPHRWRQSVPRPPVIPPEQRRELARQWVDFLDVQPSEDFVEQLAAVVMRYHPHSLKGQLANDFVRAGVVPYRIRVEAAYRDRRQYRTQSETSPKEVDEVLAFITEINTSTHVGPTWREVGEHLNWPRGKTRRVLLQLERQGQVTFTHEPRSLVAVRAGHLVPVRPSDEDTL